MTQSESKVHFSSKNVRIKRGMLGFSNFSFGRSNQRWPVWAIFSKDIHFVKGHSMLQPLDCLCAMTVAVVQIVTRVFLVLLLCERWNVRMSRRFRLAQPLLKQTRKDLKAIQNSDFSPVQNV
jgi:hypothetical protein